MARRALRPDPDLRPGFVIAPLSLPPGNAREAFLAFASLLPGTLPTGIASDPQALILHGLDVRQPIVEDLVARKPCSSGPSLVTDFLFVAAGLILLTVAAGLVRVLCGPREVDRMMAVQLLGTGGVAALLLAASASGVAGVEDVALGLALLAAFASIAFVNSAAGQP